MNAVIYYSNTGECKKVAEYLAEKSGFDLTDIYDINGFDFDTAVLVFPVHCQNVPAPVRNFLSRLKVNALVPVALYGKMSNGNVLYEVQKNYRHKIIAAAYIPAKHAYLEEKSFEDFEKLNPLIEKLKNPTEVKIPRSRKNPLADIAPQLRSRAGVKLYADAACNKCGACTAVCKNGGITDGKPNKKCIRCLKCVAVCPQKSLRFSLSPAMRQYLKKRKKTDLIIYL